MSASPTTPFERSVDRSIAAENAWWCDHPDENDEWLRRQYRGWLGQTFLRALGMGAALDALAVEAAAKVRAAVAR